MAMSSSELYPVSKTFELNALVNNDQYDEMYQQSINDPDVFWGKHGKRIDWIKPYTKVKETSFEAPNVRINWYSDGTLNASANCLDRHLANNGDDIAIIWEGDDAKDQRKVSYKELHHDVCKFANGLKAKGVKRGDIVSIYMPMVPEAAVAMLACARIGAVHSIIFGT